MRHTAMSGDFVKGLSVTVSEDIVNGLCQESVSRGLYQGTPPPPHTHTHMHARTGRFCVVY